VVGAMARMMFDAVVLGLVWKVHTTSRSIKAAMNRYPLDQITSWWLHVLFQTANLCACAMHLST
jgi:hypothetical protein